MSSFSAALPGTRAARLRDWWPLAAAIVVGAALRGFHLGANSLWTDEFATLFLASNPVGEILKLSSTANFVPPLYFVMVHGMLRLFGESEVTLRWLSVAAGICTIPLFWLLISELTASRTTAAIGAGLLAVNPLHLWFSQEARPYAFLLMLGCGGLLFLARALRRGALADWSGFSICSALAILTHTTGLVFLLVGWAWTLRSPDRRPSLRPLVVASIAAGLLCAPFFVAIAQSLVASHFTFHSPPRALTGLEIPYSLFTYLAGFSFGPGPRDIQNLGALAAVRTNPVESTLAAVVALAVLTLLVRERRPGMVPFGILLGISLMGMVGLAAVSGKAYNVRYTLPAMVGFLGALSVAIRPLTPGLRAVWLTTLFAFSVTADVQWFSLSRYWKEDSRAAVTWLRGRLGPDARVAVAPSYSAQPLAYYARRSAAQLRFVPLQPNARLVPSDLPDALVLTRLHHVPNWTDLRTEFMSAPGVRTFNADVPGYEIFLRTSTPSVSGR